MSPLDSSVCQQRPEIDTLKAILELAKMPSSRQNLVSDTQSWLNAPAGKISFKWGKKVMGKWYQLVSQESEPLLTQ